MVSSRIQKLREKQKALSEQIRREENKLNTQKRKEDTRRKILMGAWLEDEIKNRQDFKEYVYKKLDSFLSRPDDRALFDFPAPPPAPVAKTSEQVTSVAVAEVETEPA